ncbi:MAG: cytochrome b/b6 domain-containing protein [Thermincolia bacterium]
MEKNLIYPQTGRLLHWLIMISMALLALSGLYIHSPLQFPLFDSMDIARLVHFIFMYIMVMAAGFKLFYVFHRGDLVKLTFRSRDLQGFLELIKYYIFLKKDMPLGEEYNPGQKATYIFWFLLLLVQAFTGFILYWPGSFDYIAHLLGGMAMIRLVHYLITWVFLCSIFVHVYLVFLTGEKVLSTMINGYPSWIKKKLTE